MLWTSLAAGVVWASVMTGMLVFPDPSRSFGLKLGLGIALAVVGLSAIGAAQWLELKRHVHNASRWIGWTALGWALALPWSFVPGPFVDEWTPAAAHIALWSTGGAIMAYVFALVTWQGAKRLAESVR